MRAGDRAAGLVSAAGAAAVEDEGICFAAAREGDTRSGIDGGSGSLRAVLSTFAMPGFGAGLETAAIGRGVTEEWDAVATDRPVAVAGLMSVGEDRCSVVCAGTAASDAG